MEQFFREKSGVSEKPMKDAVPFASPESMKVTMDLPYAGKSTGMGIKKGNHLDRGWVGYHGKSTLLKRWKWAYIRTLQVMAGNMSLQSQMQ